LRFGIEPAKVDSVIGASTDSAGTFNFRKFDYSNVVLETIKRGYKHIELNLDLFHLLHGGFRKNAIENLLKIKNNYDITYSVHLPLWSIEPSSPNRFIREGSANCLIDAVEKVEALDPEIYVLHATGALTAEFSRWEIPKQYINIVMKWCADFGVSTIKQVIKETNLDPSKLAFETIEFPLDNTLDQIKKIKGAKLCIDTGHVLAKYPGDINLLEITKKYLDITSEFHLHDGFFLPSKNGGKLIGDHMVLGEGQLPIEFLKFIYEKDFQGPIVFELSFEQAKKSIEFIKKHVPEIEIDIGS